MMLPTNTRRQGSCVVFFISLVVVDAAITVTVVFFNMPRAQQRNRGICGADLTSYYHHGAIGTRPSRFLAD